MKNKLFMPADIKSLCVLFVVAIVIVLQSFTLSHSQPLVFQAGRNVKELFGYSPEYTQNVPVFDSMNRPYIRSRTADINGTSYVHTLQSGKWTKKGFISFIKAAYPDFQNTQSAGGWFGARIVFDSNDIAYTIVKIRLKDGSSKNVLLCSRDYCDTFTVHELPYEFFAHECYAGHNEITGPPFIAAWKHYKEHAARWTNHNSLYVIKPGFKDGKLIITKPVFVTNDFFGMAQHSGGASFAVTKGNKTHFVWAEVTDKDLPGAPTYIATYYHDINTVSKKKLLAYAPPINDVHNTPGICIDSEGFLHVITGAHGQPFKYTRSLMPNEIFAGWTKPVDILETGYKENETDLTERGRQTYLAFVCDKDDNLHIVFRQWRKGVDQYHDGSKYAALSYQRKLKGKQWDKNARPLVIAALPDYSIFYHKLTMDHLNRIFLSFSYISGEELNSKQRRPGLYHDRMVIMSEDEGNSWEIATTAKFMRRKIR